MALCGLITRAGDQLVTRAGDRLVFRPTEECAVGTGTGGLPPALVRALADLVARRRSVREADEMTAVLAAMLADGAL